MTRNKLVEAAAAVLEGASGSLPITSLNKALFYLDLRCLLDTGETLTGATYIALRAGPVVAKYKKRVIDTLEDLGIAQQDDAEDGYSKPVSLVDMPVYECLSKEEQTLARTFGAKAAMRTPSWLSSYSHENIGWKLAWDAGLGAQRPAVRVDLRIGMQQLLDRDPWLDEAPDADLAELLRSSDTDMGSPW